MCSSDLMSAEFCFFFFKQKTAYEIKECDWSSDVCSSDLRSRLSLIGVPILGYVYNGSPLRREMTVSEGSTADVLGDMGSPRSRGEKSKSGFGKRRQR